MIQNQSLNHEVTMILRNRGNHFEVAEQIQWKETGNAYEIFRFAGTQSECEMFLQEYEQEFEVTFGVLPKRQLDQ